MSAHLNCENGATRGPQTRCSGTRVCPETTLAASSTRTGSIRPDSHPTPGCRALGLPRLMSATPPAPEHDAGRRTPRNLPRVRRWLTRCASGPVGRQAKARASARSIGRAANPVATPQSLPRRKQTERARGHADHGHSCRSRRRCAFEALGPTRLFADCCNQSQSLIFLPGVTVGAADTRAASIPGPSGLSAVAGRPVAWRHMMWCVSTD